jgi:hypothetical protein
MIVSPIIAMSGVGSDSAATVIGAKIAAPLMTPILGTMLAIVIGDGCNFLFCLMLVLTGAGRQRNSHWIPLRVAIEQ